MSDAPSASTLHTVLNVACLSMGLTAVMRLSQRSFRLFSSNQFSADENTLMFAVFIIAIIAALVTYLLIRDRIDALFLDSRRNAVIATAACAMCFCMLALAFKPLFAFNALLGAISATLYSFLLGLCACVWGCILFKAPLTNALVSIAIMPALVRLMLLIGRALPISSTMMTVGVVAFMPLLCYFAFNPLPSIKPLSDFKMLRQLPAPTLVVLLCAVYTCSIAAGVLSLDDPDHTAATELFALFVVAVAISAALAVSIAIDRAKRRQSAVVHLTCIILVIATLFIAIISSILGSGHVLSMRLVNVACTFCVAGVLVVATHEMQREAISPTMVSCLFALAALFVPQLVSRIITPAVNTVANNALLQYQEIAILVVSGLLIVVAFIALVPLRPPTPEDAEGDDSEARLQKAYDTIARGYGLTAREQEVMQLIAEGNTMRKVGETLFISLGTVQSHSKKIYKKLDIHSRQELLDLIERHSS